MVFSRFPRVLTVSQRHSLLWAAVVLLLFALAGCGSGGNGNGSDSSQRAFPLASLAQTDVRIGGDTFRVWVMDTPARRNEGMMFLSDSEVGTDEGMLFVYPGERPLSFWMRNTGIPLEIAYIDGDGRIFTIAQMTPFDETGVESGGPAMYALEFKQGTLARHNIVPGMTVEIPANIIAVE